MLWLWTATVSVTGSCKPSLHRVYMFLMWEGSVSAQSSICTEREVCAFLYHCGLEWLPLDSEWAEQQIQGVSCLPDTCYFDICDTFWVETSKDLTEGDFSYTTVFSPSLLSLFVLFDEHSPPFSTQCFLHVANSKYSAPYIPIVFECYVGVQMF